MITITLTIVIYLFLGTFNEQENTKVLNISDYEV